MVQLMQNDRCVARSIVQNLTFHIMTSFPVLLVVAMKVPLCLLLAWDAGFKKCSSMLTIVTIVFRRSFHEIDRTQSSNMQRLWSVMLIDKRQKHNTRVRTWPVNEMERYHND